MASPPQLTGVLPGEQREQRWFRIALHYFTCCGAIMRPLKCSNLQNKIEIVE
jgi:hypothetical protein